MNFLISDSFTASLARLEGDEQKLAKIAALDLQLNPAHPGLQFHKLDRAKDKHFCSVRVSRDIRIIVHRTEDSFLLCFVGHHDDAYAWAEKRKLETHPTTGAAQLVEIRQRVVEVDRYVEAPLPKAAEKPKPSLFASISEEDLLRYGVPPEWLQDVLLANEDTLLDLADHLPSEAAEALLELATGGKPQVSAVTPTADPFEHPDAQRRFRTIENVEELERALDYPWDRWAIFLHPAQRQLVERDYSGSARVAGSAGTGKTVVALHRAVFLAKNNEEARVLLTTFSHTLANALHNKLNLLLRHDPKIAERIDVLSMQEAGIKLFKGQLGSEPAFVGDAELRQMIERAAKAQHVSTFPLKFLVAEWKEIVDAWQLKTWDDYRDVKRLGRRTRLREDQRAALWRLFEVVLDELRQKGLTTPSEMFMKLAAVIPQRRNPPYDYVVVDEAQDVSITQLRFLAAMGGSRPNALFFAGDLGQRIFQQPFSWLAQGVDIRGRSRTLQINYRTSHQIRSHADRLLDSEVRDVDGVVETRVGTISVFNGALPDIYEFKTPEEERDMVAHWLNRRGANEIKPHEIGIFVRSEAELPRAIAAVEAAELTPLILDDHVAPKDGFVSVATMHLAKGLEFKAVSVMACDDEVIPLQERIETATDSSDLAEVYNTERHLLYVACTRSRDHLIVTCGGPASEFLGDLTPHRKQRAV